MGFALSFLVGLGVGAFSVFLGVGGGALIVPILPFIAEVSPRETIATSLVVVFLVACQNTYAFHKRGLVDWKAGVLIGTFSALGSFLAGRATAFVSTQILGIAFGSFLFAMGLLTIRRARKSASATNVDRSTGAAIKTNVSPAQNSIQNVNWFLIVALGVFTGFTSGFTGVGGGLMVVSVLSMLAWTPQEKVVPTSVLTIVFSAGSGALAFLTENVSASEISANFGLARLDLAVAIFLGAFVCSLLLQKRKASLNPRKRDWLVGCLLLALSLRSLINVFAAR